jgi:hypothetical protein
MLSHCLHTFCFECIKRWYSVLGGAECPICKQQFTFLVHDVQSATDYGVWAWDECGDREKMSVTPGLDPDALTEILKSHRTCCLAGDASTEAGSPKKLKKVGEGGHLQEGAGDAEKWSAAPGKDPCGGLKEMLEPRQSSCLADINAETLKIGGGKEQEMLKSVGGSDREKLPVVHGNDPAALTEMLEPRQTPCSADTNVETGPLAALKMGCEGGKEPEILKSVGGSDRTIFPVAHGKDPEAPTEILDAHRTHSLAKLKGFHEGGNQQEKAMFTREWAANTQKRKSKAEAENSRNDPKSPVRRNQTAKKTKTGMEMILAGIRPFKKPQ